ncbi:MAG TPA: tetraacyldisaccharide 4'-kinase [Syntrophorhabdaceae bacterium]|nr:tetraacyldisaccharide 4'-kinase [Syntrophorhabdaceae bacterium]HOT41770.1 tetraacyldisaccharide 4'-kinase [Syntrophorhabdaceae bacterium]HPC67206.1 tetraacyldisaccharide 4'-kinase [Syntrophorhabdaceae bacterium]HQE79426.1 tetraacyldisaccharide 4'-kinase [Syntrophorhabdaceae bacterium]HQH42810.1 tetraacyldisaccharide 4'-kinase [Syntrophorhabdaceae bacterium]
MHDTIIKVWNNELRFLRWALYIPLSLLALIYRVLLSLREYGYKRGFFKTAKAAVFVISVGNLTLGGTGKTSVVERLATRLKEIGMNPGIVTRGYKRKRKGTFCVDIKKDSAHDVGDEAFMLAHRTRLPVLVGDKKHEAVEMGIRDFNIDVAILDDGFQTRVIKKDLEIVVIQGGNPSVNTDLFPLGPYREPIKSIKRADIALIHKGEPNHMLDLMTMGIPRFRMRYKPAYLYNIRHDMIAHYNLLKEKNILAFSGLGDNASFFKMIGDLGGRIIYKIPFPDHHDYSVRDIKRLSAFKDIDLMVTTAKDAVKIHKSHAPEKLFYLAVDIEIERENEFMGNILSRIQQSRFKTYVQ